MSRYMRYAAEIHPWPSFGEPQFYIAAVFRHGSFVETFEAQYRSECEEWLTVSHPGAEQVPPGWTPWRKTL